MKTLINVYAAVIGRIKFLGDRNLTEWLKGIETKHPSIGYFIKKSIITDNLYGVDVMEEATEIARLRLFLALVASAQQVDDLEPLPNIDFNILAGNSLMGLLRVRDEDFESRFATQHPDADAKLVQEKLFRSGPKLHQRSMFRRTFKQVLEEKNRLIDGFRHATDYAEDLTGLRDSIEAKKREAYETLNDILLDEFNSLGIKHEQATWDDKKKAEGKPTKRPLKPADIEALHPVHWGFEFDAILHKNGGFDAIIANPPWEIFKPNGKEFFEEYSDVVTKKNMTIHEFEKEQTKLLGDADIRAAWLDYLSEYPHQSAYFRSAPQYKNQISVVNGKKAGTDINLYKLFVEQCFNLLRPGGQCGMVIPSGIYTDLGSKQLREVLFSQCQLGPLFGITNERFLFEGLDHRFKICVTSFTKGGTTKDFLTAFRIHPREAVRAENLEQFLHNETEHIRITTDLIRRLSPDSLSVMEFRSDLDVHIAEKMAVVPFLGKSIADRWSVQLSQEMHMTNDSDLFKDTPGRGRVPLVQGNMVHQFNHAFANPKYWINLKEGRSSVLGRQEDSGQTLAYECYRLVHRRIARNSDERTAIACVMPPSNFCGDTAQTTRNIIAPDALIFLTAVFNSFVADWEVRHRVSAHMDMHFVYKMRIPRLTARDAAFSPIVDRAARLICTTSEFDDLAKEVGLKSHRQGVTDGVERAKLRAELDGLIAHLYGLTESEFAHILTTFPLVPDPAKIAAQNAYRDAERGLLR